MPSMYMIAYADTQTTVVFEMISGGNLSPGETVSGQFLAVDSSAFVNITTLTYPTVTELSSLGVYKFVLENTEIGSNDGIAKLVFTAGGCDDTVITIQVVGKIPSETVLLSDKEDIVIAESSWDEYDARLYDTYRGWEIKVGMGNFLWAPAAGAGSSTPAIKSADGSITRWYFTGVDPNGNRPYPAVRSWVDNPEPGGGS